MNQTSKETRTKKGLFSWYFDTNLLTRIMIALIAGCVIGIALGYGDPETIKSFVNKTKFFGDIFIRLLKMIVLPVVAFSIITGAAGIAPSRLGKMGVKVLIFYMITSACSVVIGLSFAAIFSPGEGMNIVGDAAKSFDIKAQPAMLDILLNVVPTNIFESLMKGDILPIIFFSMLFGLSIAYLKDSKDETLVKGADILSHGISAAAEVMYKIVRGVMEYAPIGVFFLISKVFAEQGAKALGPLFNTTATVYLSLFVLLIVVYGALLKIWGLSLPKFLKGSSEAIITAFVTRSSSGTLPISMRVAEENLGVPRSISGFSLPLGATINMNGTAIYLGVCAVFITNAIGLPMTLEQQITVIATATLAAIGTAGVPGSGAIMLLMVLESIGLKIEPGSAIAAAYAMILGIDALLDMGRTSLNVTGDIVVSTIVAKQEGDLDMSKWA